MAFEWAEAERDVDPTGCIRIMVRAGLVTTGTVDEFVRRQLAENAELYCSPERLRDYVLALIRAH